MTDVQKILFWLARIIASVAILFFLIFVIGKVASEISVEGLQLKIEGLLFLLFLIFAGFSTILSWRRPKLGAFLLLISGLCLAIFSFIIGARNKALVALIIGGPFILSAILIYLARREQRSKALMKIE